MPRHIGITMVGVTMVGITMVGITMVGITMVGVAMVSIAVYQQLLRNCLLPLLMPVHWHGHKALPKG